MGRRAVTSVPGVSRSVPRAALKDGATESTAGAGRVGEPGDGKVQQPAQASVATRGPSKTVAEEARGYLEKAEEDFLQFTQHLGRALILTTIPGVVLETLRELSGSRVQGWDVVWFCWAAGLVLGCMVGVGEVMQKHQRRRAAARLPPRKVVLTGGSRGLGKAMAREFLLAGDDVLLTSRSEEGVEEALRALQQDTWHITGRAPLAVMVKAESKQPGSTESTQSTREVWELPQVHGEEQQERHEQQDHPQLSGRQIVVGIACDVRSAIDVQMLADVAGQELERVDIWVNNAGTNPMAKPFVDLEDHELEQVVSTNLLGSLLCTRAAMHLMQQQPQQPCNQDHRVDHMAGPVFSPVSLFLSIQVVSTNILGSLLCTRAAMRLMQQQQQPCPPGHMSGLMFNLSLSLCFSPFHQVASTNLLGSLLCTRAAMRLMQQQQQPCPPGHMSGLMFNLSLSLCFSPFHQVVSTNLLGSLLCTRAAMRLMQQQQQPCPPGHMSGLMFNLSLSLCFSPFHQVVSTNLLGSLLCTRAAMRLMQQQQPSLPDQTAGHVFNLEGAGSWGGATPQYAAYGATKCALRQLGLSLVEEGRLGGRVGGSELGSEVASAGGSGGASEGASRGASSGKEVEKGSGRRGRVGIHAVSPGLVLTDLLLSGATVANKQAFNIVGEHPETVARVLVPQMRTVRGTGSTVSYLTPPRIVLAILSAWMRRGRWFDQQVRRRGDIRCAL
ncbi:unnamed protein product [Closterium sp. Naga37s-1]|nr:unnamed protein product [Closterium sp. Naga37s-1]